MSKVLSPDLAAPFRCPDKTSPHLAHPFGIEMKMKPFQFLELASTRSFVKLREIREMDGNGIYFQHFSTLFSDIFNISMPQKCRNVNVLVWISLITSSPLSLWSSQWEISSVTPRQCSLSCDESGKIPFKHQQTSSIHVTANPHV